MSKIRWFFVTGAAVFAMAAFAQGPPVPQERHDRDQNLNQQRAFHRDHDRIRGEGKIRTMTHEKGGYRVQLDRGDDHFWVPDSYVRDHENDFRIGAALTFDGIFRGGLIYVDAVGWPEAGRYGDRHDRQETTVRGMVDRVDTRRNIVVIRDERTRRRITIDASRMEQPRGPLGPFMGQMGGIRVRDLHRGDYVELSGYWDEETFVARHVDRVRNDRR